MQWIMAILSKGCKLDYFESDNSLKPSFTGIWDLHSNLLIVSLFLNQTLLIFLLYLRQTWMTQLILEISLWEVIFFNPKRFYYSYVWSCSLCEGRTSFYTGLISRKICKCLLNFSTGFTSLSISLLSPLLITFFVFMHGFWFNFHLT